MKLSRAAVGIVMFAVAQAAAAPAPFTAANFAARLTVESVATRPAYGPTTAPAGRQFLVLATSWENRIDPKLAEERGLAPGYGVEDLAQHLYVVVDGAVRGELRAGLDDGAGHRSLGSVMLPKTGAKVSGDVVFEIPAGAYASADLRFYDDTAGDLKLALAGAARVRAPLRPPQRNAVGEFAVFAFEDPAPERAPPGFRAVAVDLRARSEWLSDKEAPAYDPNTPPGTTVKRVNLLDWTEPRKYLYVLADGVYACPPVDGGALPETPRFIPEFLTGWRVAFLVPRDARSLELVCEMPHAATDEGTLNLPPLRFALAGSPVAAAPPAAALVITDEMFTIGVAARRAASFAGEPPGDGRQFVVLDVTVTNTGDTGEFFQPKDQLLVLNADGSELAPDDLSARGPHRPPELVHVPPHEHRRFEIAYRLDAAVARPQLSFHGGEFMKAYDLPVSP